MAIDFILPRSPRSFCRDNVSSLPPRPVVINSAPRGPGLLGYSIGIMLATRVLSGKWPWYWFKRVDQKLDR